MERHADLIVIGSGAAGLSAALTAAELGLSVLVLEKEGVIGGSSLMSGGSLCFVNTDIQSANGVTDSQDRLREDLLRVGGGYSKPEVVEAYVANQTKVYEWMRSIDIPFASGLKASPGNSVLRTHTSVPTTFIPILHDKALATGKVEILYGAHALKLVTDFSTGRVSGVEVWSDDLSEVHARHGVILATGGFTRAPDLIGRFSPNFAHARVSGGAGNTGDGLLMAWKLGADILDTAFLQGNFGVHPEGKSNAVVHPIFKGGIAVNSRGHRYVDESISYKRHSEACLAQPGHVTYQIFDQTIFDRGDDSNPFFSFKSRLGLGEVISAESLEGLAGKLGIPAENLAFTVARYNAGVDAGRDGDFGREQVGNNGGPLVKIETGPFYAYPSTVVILGTYCGIRVDSSMRVVDVFEEPIPGLYAAGEIVGGFHGKGEIPGAALGKALVFGRVAAQSAANSEGLAKGAAAE